MRRGFVHVDYGGNNILLTVSVRKETGAIRKEFFLFMRRQTFEKLSVRTHNKRTHQNCVLANFRRQVELGYPAIDVLRVGALSLNDIVVVSGVSAVYLRIVSRMVYISFILLFDGRNIRLVIFFHVTNQIAYFIVLLDFSG